MYLQHILLKLRKRILKCTLNEYRVHWLSSNLPISIKITVTIRQLNCVYLHDSYNTKFVFMNYGRCMVVISGRIDAPLGKENTILKALGM